MENRKLTLPKNERLSWKRQIDLLFSKGNSFVAYPLRIIYHITKKTKAGSSVSLLVSVPKKKIKSAANRNYIKRRIRESYRLHKSELTKLFVEKDVELLIAYIYLDHKKLPYNTISRSVEESILTLLKKSL